MAVLLIATIKRYQALSTDEWPTPGEQPEGSTLHIIDVIPPDPIKYVIHDGAWVEDLR